MVLCKFGFMYADFEDCLGAFTIADDNTADFLTLRSQHSMFIYPKIPPYMLNIIEC